MENMGGDVGWLEKLPTLDCSWDSWEEVHPAISSGLVLMLGYLVKFVYRENLHNPPAGSNAIIISAPPSDEPILFFSRRFDARSDFGHIFECDRTARIFSMLSYLSTIQLTSAIRIPQLLTIGPSHICSLMRCLSLHPPPAFPISQPIISVRNHLGLWEL